LMEFDTLLTAEMDTLKRRLYSWYEAEQTMLEQESGLPRNQSRTECFSLALPHYEKCYNAISSHVEKDEKKNRSMNHEEIDRELESILRNSIEDLNLVKACHEACLDVNVHWKQILRVMHEGFQQVARAWDVYRTMGLVTNVLSQDDEIDIKKTVGKISSGGKLSLKQGMCEVMKSCGRIGLL